MTGIRKMIKTVCGIFCRVGCAVVFAMMALMVVDIALRYFLNKPIMGSYEIVEVLMMSLVVLGLAHTQTKDGHIRVTMFVDHMSAKPRALVDAFGFLTASLMMFLVAYAGVAQAMLTKEQMVTTMVLLIPLYPFYYVLSLGYLAYAIVLLFDAIESIRLFMGGKPQEPLVERTVNLNH